MKLTIIAIAASVYVKFTTPGPGDFWLYSVKNGHALVIMSDRIAEAGETHVTCKLPKDKQYEFYSVAFRPDP